MFSISVQSQSLFTVKLRLNTETETENCDRKLYNMEEFNDTINLGENVVKVLKGIFDPEIPVDIYELGLIYDVMINEDNDVKILMTLTSPNCPVAETLPQEVEEKVKSIDAVKSCEVEITFDPPWSKDLMSEEAKLELGML